MTEQAPQADAEPENDAEPQADAELNVEPVEAELRRSFDQLGYSQLNSIQCSAEGTEILLTGVLDSFYLKQVAQSVAVKVAGVRSVRNEIEVR